MIFEKFSRILFSKDFFALKIQSVRNSKMVRWDSPENAFKVPPNWRRAQEEIEKELLQQRRKVSYQTQTSYTLSRPKSYQSKNDYKKFRSAVYQCT